MALAIFLHLSCALFAQELDLNRDLTGFWTISSLNGTRYGFRVVKAGPGKYKLPRPVHVKETHLLVGAWLRKLASHTYEVEWHLEQLKKTAHGIKFVSEKEKNQILEIAGNTLSLGAEFSGMPVGVLTIHGD